MRRVTVFWSFHRPISAPSPKNPVRHRQLRFCGHVVIVLIPGIYALVPVTLHQGFDIAALGLLEVVLDGQRTDLIPVERKATKRLELAAFDVQADEMNESRRFGGLEDFPEGDRNELNRPRFLSRLFPASKGVLDATQLARFAED